ncbi:MAG: peroxidase family protein [Microcoleaceae cyanobacterium]
MLEVTKNTDINVETELNTDIDDTVDLNQSMDLNFDSTVDIDGNLANLNFDVTAIGDNSSAESNISVVVTDNLSEINGSLSAGVGNNTLLVEFRTINGAENNPNNPDWGTPETQLSRLTPVAYEDSISEPRGGDTSVLPSPREISNIVFDQSESILNSAGVSDWFWQWGQFLDHDLDLTPATSGEAFNILVPAGDAEFDPTNTGNQEIDLTRSIFDSSTGTSVSNPREQINEITAYIDGSNVYGSDQERAEALRTLDGTGRLETSLADNGEILLPFNTEGLENDDPFNRPANQLFLGGDIRANEQVGLTATHSLFVREHNRLAEEMGQRLDENDAELVDLFEESGLSRGDFIYEAARRIVGAEIQAITYNEFLPLLFGNNTLENYSGYDETVNIEISNEFSTAAFRFGHTMLSSTLQNGTSEGLALRDSFFNPDLVTTGGVDDLLSGLASQAAQEIDAMVIDDVRNFLFGQPGNGGFDLTSLNIQRGRDHGIASYTEVREELGLDPITNFADISSDPEVQADLEAAYGSIDQVDLWVGGLAEDHVNGGLVGETFQVILLDQFTRLRDGDRFYYENDQLFSVLAPDIEDTTLADVILNNSSISNIQENVFLV